MLNTGRASSRVPHLYIRNIPYRTRSVVSGAGLVPDRVHDAGVGKRGDVTEIALLRDITQQPAHDLSGARLGQVGRAHDLLRPRELADHLGAVVRQLPPEDDGGVRPGPLDDVAEARLA